MQPGYEIITKKLVGASPTIFFRAENSNLLLPKHGTSLGNNTALLSTPDTASQRYILTKNNRTRNRIHPYQREIKVQFNGYTTNTRGDVESETLEGIHLQMSRSYLQQFLTSVITTYNYNPQPKRIAITRRTYGYSIVNDVVMRGSVGAALPNPMLIIAKENSGELMVCDESGLLKGKIKHHLSSVFTNVNEILVRENQQELLVSYQGFYGTVLRLDFAGRVLGYSSAFENKAAFGMCLLPGGQAVAVCDAWDKSVKILSLPDLTLLRKHQHGNLNHPVSIAVSPQLKWWFIIDYVNNNDAYLKIFDQDFNLIGRVDKTFFKAQSIQHFEGNVLVTDCHRITSFTESGTQIDSIGQGGTQDNDFQRPVGMGFFMSSVGEPTLVVADCNNDRLKFYKPVNGI